jgi:hypothetical protein
MADTVETRTEAAGRLIRADDIVQTLSDTVMDGRMLPAGSLGRVAYADRGSGWHSVGFDEPFQCSAFLKAGSVRLFDGVPDRAVPDAFGLHQGGPVPPHPYQEFEAVRTLVDVIEDGETVPAGSIGTIVDVSQVPGYYEVEFAMPFACVVSMTAEQITY